MAEIKAVEFVIDQDYLDTHPEAVEKGFVVGQTVSREETPEEAEAREAAEAPFVGAACTTDDGKDGTYAQDAGGHFVCVPNETEAASTEVGNSAGEGEVTMPTSATANGERHPLA